MRSSNGTPLSSALIPVSASNSVISCRYSCPISAPDQNRQTILVPFSVAGTVFATGAVAARGAAGSVDVSRGVVDVGAAVGTAVQATKIPRAEEAEVVIANLSNERRENVAIAVLLTPRTGAQTARDQRSVRSGEVHGSDPGAQTSCWGASGPADLGHQRKVNVDNSCSESLEK